MTPTRQGTLREKVQPRDRDVVRRIVAATRMFTEAEVDVAVELVDEHIAHGSASGYELVFLDIDGETVGYACYGEIPCTVGSYDLYWIAVRPERHGHGFGRRLLTAVEERIAARGGRAVYVETSARATYAPTRRFYGGCGYVTAARFPDFYAPGDDKVVYVKRLGHDAVRRNGHDGIG